METVHVIWTCTIVFIYEQLFTNNNFNSQGYFQSKVNFFNTDLQHELSKPVYSCTELVKSLLDYSLSC